MTRTLLTTLLAAAMVLTSPASAQAVDHDPRNCTRQEYRKIKDGMTRDRVTRILDGPGRLYGSADSGDYHFRSRLYGRGAYTHLCVVDYVRIGPHGIPQVVYKMWM